MWHDDVYPAHIRRCPDGTYDVQTVEQHCRSTAIYAEEYLKIVGLGKCAYLAGLLHDCGKFSPQFRSYIIAASNNENVRRGAVTHSSSGVRLLFEDLSAKRKRSLDNLVVEIIGYAIGAHHGQFDCINEDGDSGFDNRIRGVGNFCDESSHYGEIRRNFLEKCVSADQLVACYDVSYCEIERLSKEILEKDGLVKSIEQSTLCFYFGALARLIQSAVIDGDRTDTAEFMNNVSYPHDLEDKEKVWSDQLFYAEKKIRDFPNNSAINRSRQLISDTCRKAAENTPGLFELNIPTGAGKTLCSLRFALAHAKKWNKSKIIFVSPLLSILEQNAKVIRDYIEDQSLILEHHSNVVQPEEFDRDRLNASELLIETWNSPIIITTLVQLLNTMFSGKTSCIRRFHALCEAVIIIDEVQSVPNNLLTMFNHMVQFLSGVCGATIVFCSATQPAFQEANYPITMNIRQMVPYDPHVWEPFVRTKIESLPPCSLEDLSNQIENVIAQTRSLLIVCNKKSESEQLFRTLSSKYQCYHLSAAMCMEHRRGVLEEVKTAIKEGKQDTVICISTQVIEAGVDISFEMVIRLMAGMDSIVQAAGRCNRNHESDSIRPVYMINCMDENLNYLHDIRRGKDATIQLLYEYEQFPGKFDREVSSKKAIDTYYRNLYREMPEEYQDDLIPNKSYTVFSLLSRNEKMTGKEYQLLRQAFRLAGKYFSVFGDDTLDVIVPYKKGKEIIADLCSENVKSNLRELLREARNYTVTLYPYQKKALESKNAIIRMSNNLDVYCLAEGFYEPDTGVVFDEQKNGYLGV